MIVQKPTPHKSSREGHKVSLVVIHGDAGKTDAGTISWLADPTSRVSYHYLVGRDGRIYQFVPESQKAWHAGISAFNAEKVVNSVNPFSIGICFANDGTGREQYTTKQYTEGAKLLAAVCRRHSVPLHRVVGHYQVSPGRKTDPWLWFDWEHFFSLFGEQTRLLQP